MPLPAAPAGFCGVSCRRLPLEVTLPFWLKACPAPAVELCLGSFYPFWPHLPALLLRWWRELGCLPSLVFSWLHLLRPSCRCSLGSAPCVRVLPLWLCLLVFRLWWCLVAPRAFRALLVVLSSPPAVLSLCGGLCYVHCLFSLALGWMCF